MTTSATWKAGRLAETSGLTVRTLHRWDTIGLLSPSQRTTGGHREYTEDDLVRLYHVLALRSLGLALDTIAVCLDAGVDPTRLVRDHLAAVEASIAALGVLRERLVRLGEELSADQAPAAMTLLDALRAIGDTGPEGEHAGPPPGCRRATGPADSRRSPGAHDALPARGRVAQVVPQGRTAPCGWNPSH
ncbi:MerR family transcriptional regulator (plasmid) [Streptomyces sp. NBC_01527]|nr:MerR family transcriptional regulator [Streptomyces sp. NBC_01230]